MPGAVWIYADGLADQAARVRKAITASGAGPDTAIVVTGDGPFGWDSYNAALQLVSQGFHSVQWYRGGTGAWRAAGMQTEDRRPL
jgi:3-mercaptopyruvate sulfurtransferase SseA